MPGLWRTTKNHQTNQSILVRNVQKTHNPTRLPRHNPTKTPTPMTTLNEYTDNLHRVHHQVGKTMILNPPLRLHKNRSVLITAVRHFVPEASAESITRSQRKHWENALAALDKGDGDYAWQYLPHSKKDFAEWCKLRKISFEAYKKYFG